LDTVGRQITVDMIASKKLFKNIRVTTKLLNLQFNAGMAALSKIDNLNGYRGVWFCPEGISNILLLRTSRRNLFLPMTVMPFIDLKCR